MKRGPQDGDAGRNSFQLNPLATVFLVDDGVLWNQVRRDQSPHGGQLRMHGRWHLAVYMTGNVPVHKRENLNAIFIAGLVEFLPTLAFELHDAGHMHLHVRPNHDGPVVGHHGGPTHANLAPTRTNSMPPEHHHRDVRDPNHVVLGLTTVNQKSKSEDLRLGNVPLAGQPSANPRNHIGN